MYRNDCLCEWAWLELRVHVANTIYPLLWLPVYAQFLQVERGHTSRLNNQKINIISFSDMPASRSFYLQYHNVSVHKIYRSHLPTPKASRNKHFESCMKHRFCSTISQPLFIVDIKDLSGNGPLFRRRLRWSFLIVAIFPFYLSLFLRFFLC